MLLANGAEIETRDSDGRTPLWIAADNGHADVVRALVYAGADVNTKRNDGVFALSNACQKGHTDVLRAFVSAGADVNTHDDDGCCALGHCSAKGHIEVVRKLLDNGAETDNRNSQGDTPLMIAACYGHTDVVRALVSAGADVNAQRNDRCCALLLASDQGQVEVVSLLLDNGAEIETGNDNGVTSLICAACLGHTHIVCKLVSAGADVNARSNSGTSVLDTAILARNIEVASVLTAHGADVEAKDEYGGAALCYAAYTGRTDAVNMLLKHGASTETRNINGYTPLLVAADNGHTDVVRALLSAGADVNAQRNDGVCALSIASQKGYIELVNVLINNKVKIETTDNVGCTPLISAAFGGHADAVHALLSAGAKVNTKRNDGVCALSAACRRWHTEVVNLLLDNGAQVESRDDDGGTPLLFAVLPVDENAQLNDGASVLDFASERGHKIEVIKLLLKNGAQIETMENGGRTALWLAAATGQTDVVRALVSARADVNTQQNEGDSALSIASANGHIKVVKFLLENGARIETRDNEGVTALWCAIVNGHTDVVRALVSAGADVNTQRNDGLGALIFASQRGHTHVVNLLIEKMKNEKIMVNIETTDGEGSTPLKCAAFAGKTGVVRALVSAGADVNAQSDLGFSALSDASRSGYCEIVDMLLENGAKIEIRDNFCLTPLFHAAFFGHVKVVELLIDRGADVDAFAFPRVVMPTIAYAISEGQRDVVMTLINHGAKVKDLADYCTDTLVTTALACPKNVEEILHLLISKGICVNHAKCGKKPSALMLAAQRGRIDTVETLLKHSADMYDRNFENMQAIDVASYYGHTDVVRFLSNYDSSATVPRGCSLYTVSAVGVDCRCNTPTHLTTDLHTMRSLLENGADVEAENIDGLRPIHCAVRTGLVELVELLIQHGANIDAADTYGNRPLHDAVSRGLNVVQLLVQHGAKLNVQNIDGKTPLHTAVERQRYDVTAFFLSKDADVGLTDVWRNTPLHYFTSELFAVSGEAERIVRALGEIHQQQFFIRNAVDVSMSMPIAAHGLLDNQHDEAQSTVAEVPRLDSQHMAQTRYINFFCREKLETDDNGNTPLHYAVGVYGQLKMFKVSTGVRSTVDFLVKHGADINAQNRDGLTPLHVARGKEAIEACLQHADEQSFTITDNRGRNFWHLLFHTRTHNRIALETTKRPMTAAPDDGMHNVDDLGRTPLHYACMNNERSTVQFRTLADEFIDKFSDEHINKQDQFGRTALHYTEILNSECAQVGSGPVLKAKNVSLDDRIQDNCHKTSNEYAKIRGYFGSQTSLLELRKSVHFILEHRRDISACVRNYFAESSVAVRESKAKMHETLRELIDYCDKTSYILNVWQGCRYDYRGVTCRTPVVLEEGDDQQLREREEFTTNDDVIATTPVTLAEAIQSHVNNAMEELAKAITEHDRRFACEVIKVGSSSEGTKIGLCDEFDYNFVLTDLSSICKVRPSPESPPGFVHLEASMAVSDEELKKLFDQSGILNTRVIKLKFETLVKQILSSKNFCDLTGFELTEKAGNLDSLKCRNVSKKLHTVITLTFTRPLSSYHVLHTISIDVAPALRIADWWPEDARRTEHCRAGDCLLVFTQPQNTYPWIGWTEPHGFISFAQAESRLLRECHQVAKAAYMVVKRMSQYFCQYDFFASHVIKMALFRCLDEKDSMKYMTSDGSEEVRGDELLCLVQKILRRLLCFAAQDYVPSYFLPACHQPVWLNQSYLKHYHTRLYQHGLTYKDLFSLSEQQSHDDLLLSIKSMFTFSHVMYWSLLSDDDDLELFVPTTIDPLREISYDDSDE